MVEKVPPTHSLPSAPMAKAPTEWLPDAIVAFVSANTASKLPLALRRARRRRLWGPTSVNMQAIDTLPSVRGGVAERNPDVGRPGLMKPVASAPVAVRHVR